MAITRLDLIGALFAAAALLCSGPAHAATITTTNVNTWRSSSFITGSYSIVDFYPVQQTFYNTAAGITLSPVNSTTSFQISGMDNGSYFLQGDGSQKALFSGPDAGAFLTVAFPVSGENSFLLGTTASAAHPLSLTFSDGQMFSITSSAFGVSLSHSVSWITLTSTSASPIQLSDLWYAASALPQDPAAPSTPSPTPEPATLAMTCAGGLLLVISSRSKIRNEQIS